MRRLKKERNKKFRVTHSFNGASLSCIVEARSSDALAHRIFFIYRVLYEYCRIAYMGGN